MKENIIYIILGFFIGFVFTALLSPKADWTIKQVMKNQTIEVNKTYTDSIAKLKGELEEYKDLVRSKDNERIAYNVSTNACHSMLTEFKNEVEFYHKLFLNNTNLKAIKLDTLIITKEN